MADSDWTGFSGFFCTCPLYSDSEMNYNDAVKYCDSLGMHLPIPQNENENAAFRRILPETFVEFYWLGISYRDGNYVNLLTGNNVDYINWDENQPSDKFDKIAIKRHNGKWATYQDDTARVSAVTYDNASCLAR